MNQPNQEHPSQQAVHCHTCNGTGHVRHTQGPFQTLGGCPHCHGWGFSNPPPHQRCQPSTPTHWHPQEPETSFPSLNAEVFWEDLASRDRLISSLSVQLTYKDTMIRGLNDQLVNQVATVKRLHGQVISTSELNNTLQESLQEKEQEKRSLCNPEIIARGRRIAELTNGLDDAKKENEGLRKLLTKKEQEKRSLRNTEIISLGGRVAELTNELDDAKKENGELREGLVTTRQECRNTRQMLRVATSVNNGLRQGLQVVQTSLNEALVEKDTNDNALKTLSEIADIEGILDDKNKGSVGRLRQVSSLLKGWLKKLSDESH